MTTYAEVGPDDRDVALFLVHNLHRINIWRLPLKAWVARRDETILAVLTFDHVTYPAIHVITAPDTRPFVAILKLWYMAKDWFEAIGMPLICAPVFTTLHHFQSLLRRLGFVEIGEETNAAGKKVETIYGYYLKEPPHEDQVHTTE